MAAQFQELHLGEVGAAISQVVSLLPGELKDPVGDGLDVVSQEKRDDPFFLFFLRQKVVTGF